MGPRGGGGYLLGGLGHPGPEATTGLEHKPQRGQVSKDDRGKEG